MDEYSMGLEESNTAYSEMDEIDEMTDQYSPTHELMKNGGNRISDETLSEMCNSYYMASFPRCSAFDSGAYYLVQAEVLVGKRRYREALAAALVAERICGPTKVTDAVKMICVYQMNDEERFKELKRLMSISGLGGLSETLMKQTRGTIEVSNWVPEFLNCIERMSKQKHENIDRC
eukprot:XP_001611794.1 hypothetical protein [Babesia bovis T2Bo]